MSEKTAYFALFRFHLIDTLRENTTRKKVPPVDKTELKYRHITDIFKTAQGAYLSAHQHKSNQSRCRTILTGRHALKGTENTVKAALCVKAGGNCYLVIAHIGRAQQLLGTVNSHRVQKLAEIKIRYSNQTV